MKEQKHTPGPWEIRADPHHYDSFTTVVAGSGEQRKGMLRELIVEVGGWADIEVAEANARLIAAAPDSLGALKDVLAVIAEAEEAALKAGEKPAFHLPIPLVNRIASIVRKAEGGTP